MADTKHINATVPNETVNEIVAISDKEKRSFSYIVATLLAEAVAARKSSQNGSKNDSEHKNNKHHEE